MVLTNASAQFNKVPSMTVGTGMNFPAACFVRQNGLLGVGISRAPTPDFFLKLLNPGDTVQISQGNTRKPVLHVTVWLGEQQNHKPVL